MGNSVSAANKPSDFMPPPMISPNKKEEVKIENPGTMEELHKKTKG